MKTNLQKLRISKNKSLQEVADYLGISKQTLSNYERGTREPNIATIKQLAVYYGVDLNQLLNFNLNDAQNIHDFKFDTFQEKLNYLFESSKFKRIFVYKLDVALPLDTNKHVDFEDIPRFWMNDNSDFFGIKLVDDQFSPLFLKDRNLIIKVTNSFTENDIVVINVDGKTNLFSVILQKNIPLFYNLASKNLMDIEEENPKSIHFIGRVVEVRQKISSHTEDSIDFSILLTKERYNISVKRRLAKK